MILVTHDVEETRDGIEALLSADGYGIESARSEDDAVARAEWRRPDLILVSLAGPDDEVVASATRIRHRAHLKCWVPVVVFDVTSVPEGAEVALGNNVHATWPDDFDQLRGLIRRLIN